MAYIKKPTGGSSLIVVSAILTKAGRLKLASGLDQFKIVKFAVADDLVDYTVLNLDTSYYPVLLPVANGQLMMNYKLYTDYSVNAGSNILVKIIIDNLSSLNVNTISSGTQGTLTYRPISQGLRGSLLYTFDLLFLTTDIPFSLISYKTGDGLMAGVSLGGRNISFSNAQLIIFRRKSIMSNTEFRMKVTGNSTGTFSYYHFRVKRDPAYGATTQEEK